MYKAIFHVDQNDESVMTLALNNVVNLLKAIPGEEHDLIVIFNGPGAHLLAWDGVAAHLERIKALVGEGVRFQVCRNAMVRYEIAEDQVIEECEIIPAGILSLINFQNDGFSYIKP